MVRINRWNLVFMMVVIAVSCLAAGANPAQADATTITWTAGSGNWGTASNWSTGEGDNIVHRVPQSGDHVVIPSGVSVAFSAGTSDIGSIDCSGTLNISGGTLNVNDAASIINTLNISHPGGYAVSCVNFNIPVSVAVLKMDVYSPVLGGSGDLTITGTGSTWLGGTMNGTGKIIIQNGASLSETASYYTALNRGLVNYGTFAINPGGASFSGSGTIDNYGSFNLTGGNWNTSNNPKGKINNNPGAIVRKSGTSDALLYCEFNNNGAVQVDGGTLGMCYGGISSGTYQAASSAGISFGGTTTLNSSSTINGGSLSAGGNITFNNQSIHVNTINVGSGGVAFNSPDTTVNNLSVYGSGNATFNSPAGGITLQTINLSNPGGSSTAYATFNIPVSVAVLKMDDYSPVLGGSGNLTITGTGSTWVGGSMIGTGTTIIQNGASLSETANNYTALNRSLINYGTFTINPGGAYFSGSGTIDNYGSFNLAGGNWNTSSNPKGKINNKAGGIVKRSGGSGTTCLYCPFSNDGTVQLGQNGSIYTNSYTQGSSGTLSVDISSTGCNQLQVGGAAALNGGLAVNLLSYQPNPGDSFTVMTYNSESGTFNGILNQQNYSFKPTYNSKNLVLTVTGLPPVPSISTVALNPTSSSAGSAVNVSVSVATANVDDGTTVTATLLDSGNTAQAGASGTITNNAVSLTLAVPSTLPAGSYTVQVVVSGIKNPCNTVYTINQVTLQSIAITKYPKQEYIVGEELDISGLEVTGTYSDGSKKIEAVSPADVGGFDSSKPAASQTLTVAVGGKTATYTVEIKQLPVTLQSIAITKPAQKLEYNVNDPLNISGLEVTGYYSDKSSKVETVSAADVSGFNSGAAYAGTTETLTVTIGGKTATYSVKINQTGTDDKNGGESFPIFSAALGYFEELFG